MVKPLELLIVGVVVVVVAVVISSPAITLVSLRCQVISSKSIYVTVQSPLFFKLI